MPAPLTQPGALEESLLSFGVPLAEVARCVRVAVAWRVTPNGRPLVDRRRYSRLRRNVQIVSDYLQSSCHIAPGEHWGKAWLCVGTVHVTVLHLDINGLRQSEICTVTMYKDSGLCCTRELITDCVLVLPTPLSFPAGRSISPLSPDAGPEGVGAVFSRFPLVMLCKPTTGDRWDRRAVELAAFIYTHGHCQVPLVRDSACACLAKSHVSVHEGPQDAVAGLFKSSHSLPACRGTRPALTWDRG